MPHNMFGDVQCEDLDVKSDATIRGLDVTSGNITTGTFNAINATEVTTTTITATNVNFKLGQLQRSFGVIKGKDDIASTGVHTTQIVFPAKAYIAKFGFQSTGSDVVIATTFNALLETINGTILGTAFVGVGDYTLGTGEATTVAFAAATSVRANHAVKFEVATAGVSGSVYWFADYRLNST